MNSEFFVSIKKYNYLYLSGAPSSLSKKRRDISPFVSIKTKLSLAQHFSDQNLQVFWIGFPLGLLHCLPNQKSDHTCLS